MMKSPYILKKNTQHRSMKSSTIRQLWCSMLIYKLQKEINFTLVLEVEVLFNLFAMNK